jgi:hypothetical protein
MGNTMLVRGYTLTLGLARDPAGRSPAVQGVGGNYFEGMLGLLVCFLFKLLVDN